MIKTHSQSAELILADNESEFARKVKENELNPLVSIYNKLLNLGLDETPDVQAHKYIRLTNFVSINTFLVTMVYMVIAIFWEKWLWLGTLTAMEAVCLFTLALNAYGRTTASRVVYFISSLLLLFSVSLYLGPYAQAQTFLIIAVIVPFLIFDLRKKFAVAVACVLLPVLLLLLQAVLEQYFTAYNFTIPQQMLLQKVGWTMQIAMLLSAVLQFLHYTRRAEKELDLSRQQMLAQTSELQRSNADLEQFAYIISHDLKAPVRNISSFMNLLLNKYGPTMNAEAREFISYSHSGSKRLERLIDDVLSYCRIGINLPQAVPVNLNEVVQTINFELREKLTTGNGMVTVKRELPVVNNVHASLMYHVFLNLVNNGLKFNRSEKPEITINWTNSLNHYTFFVQDNGIGISKEYANVIFQMFKRLHSEHEYDGTGIGLAICKKIVEYYHGEIWFESEPGKGTTFCFTIRKF